MYDGNDAQEPETVASAKWDKPSLEDEVGTFDPAARVGWRCSRRHESHEAQRNFREFGFGIILHSSLMGPNKLCA